MARTKQKGRRSGGSVKASKGDASAAGPSETPTAESLINKAQTLLAQSDFPLAIKFLTRALSLEPAHAEARELLGVAELEGGDEDAGRQHLLMLFPPHTPEPPSSASPYLYLAQSAESPAEALGYYSTAASMLERRLPALSKGKAKAKAEGGEDDREEEDRAMCVRCLVAMIEIWMSDLCMEAEAEKNCDDLISRALLISPNDPEVQLSLASIRMSQQRFDEAKEVIVKLYEAIKELEPFDESLPPLPARLTLARLLLEHSLHLPALDIISTIREEDSLQVEGAYLEGWALYLRAEALAEDPSLLHPNANKQGENDDGGVEGWTAEQCLEEAMGSLIECGSLYAEQDYPDEGIGGHVKELLEELEKRGVKPALAEEGEEGEDGWEDLDGAGDGDVQMD